MPVIAMGYKRCAVGIDSKLFFVRLCCLSLSLFPRFNDSRFNASTSRRRFMLLALKGRSDGGQEFFGGNRFLEEGGRADFLCSFPKAVFPAGGGEDNGDAPEVHALEILGNRKASPERHPDIHHPRLSHVIAPQRDTGS